MLILDDFVGEENATHLLITLQQDYTMDINQWDYNNRMSDIFMTGYQKAITKVQASLSNKTTRQPFPTPLQKNLALKHNNQSRKTHPVNQQSRMYKNPTSYQEYLVLCLHG